MFIKKITRFNKGTSNTYITYRLVESFRLLGKPRHRNILDLGTLAGFPIEKYKALADRIEQLYSKQAELFENSDKEVEEMARFFYKRLIKKQLNKGEGIKRLKDSREGKDIEHDYQEVDLNSFESEDGREIGSEWLCTQAISELKLKELFIEKLGWSENRFNLGMLALLGSLIFHKSDSKTANWINENSGVEEIFPVEGKEVSRKQLYKIAKDIYFHKEAIEKHLMTTTRILLKLKPTVALYDLTNTYFAGRMKRSQNASFGQSKQKRNDCPQITLGVVTDEYAFCKYSEFFAGNIGEKTTLESIVKRLDDIGKEIGYEESPIVAIDAGIASEDNLIMLHQNNYDYICVSKSKHKELRQEIDDKKLVAFMSKSKETIYAQSFEHKLKYKEGEKTKQIEETVLYVETTPKKLKENAMLEQGKERFEKELNYIKESLSKKRGHKIIKSIYERIGRLKERYPSIHSCYEINIEDNGKIVTSITWKYKPKNQKEISSGSYFIRTTLLQKDEKTIWQLYHTLTEIEDVFRTLKSDLQMRPVFHQDDIPIEAHLFLSVLAYHIVNYIRHKLKTKNIHYRWSEIIRVMNTQKCVCNSVQRKDNKIIHLQTCTRPQLKAKEIYGAMGYKEMPFHRKKIIA